MIPRKSNKKLQISMIVSALAIFLIFGGWQVIYDIAYKLPDIIFFPYMFFEGDLPKLKVVMSDSDFYSLNFEPNTPTRVDFNFNGEKREAWIEYIPSHDGIGRKSYKITTTKNDLFNGVRSIEIMPADASVFPDLLNIHQAKKAGLLVPHLKLVNLVINERSEGVYLMDEGWTKELLEIEKLPDASFIFGISQDSLNGPPPEDLNDTQIGSWANYVNPEISASDSKALATLLSAMASNNETFKQRIGTIFDLEKFYGWSTAEILAGGGSVNTDEPTFVLVFNTATGKFEPVMWPNFKSRNSPDLADRFDTLSERILSVKEFRNMRDQHLADYINDEANMIDDLNFYDEVYKNSRTDFFSDFSKRDNNFLLILKQRRQREDLVSALLRVKDFLSDDTLIEEVNLGHIENRKIYQGFEEFDDVFLSRGVFLVLNPQFSAGPDNSIVLSAGGHVFSKTVIVPRGYSLHIEPGAVLYLGKNVSIISYSPVTVGEKDGKFVELRPLNEQFSWGSFVVVGSKGEKAVFSNVNFRGGSGTLINGIVVTGMLSIHGSDTYITGSVFSESADDDALNTKYSFVEIQNSVFRNTSADAIDIDFGANDSLLENNKFSNIGYKIGGDAIDLSQSQVLIKNNIISGCSDKGISVGENSQPQIVRNSIERCDIGIAVKDLSRAKISDTILKENRVALAAYKKKDIFGGGWIELLNVEMVDNKEKIELDTASEIIYK